MRLMRLQVTAVAGAARSSSPSSPCGGSVVKACSEDTTAKGLARKWNFKKHYCRKLLERTTQC